MPIRPCPPPSPFAGGGLEVPYLAELAAGLGTVPCTPSFAMLSTDEVPESIAPYLPDHNAVLLANHGALAWGTDLWEAFDRLETVEHTAKIVMNAETLGGGVPLTAEEVSPPPGTAGHVQRAAGEDPLTTITGRRRRREGETHA